MKTNSYNIPVITSMAILLWAFIIYSSAPYYIKMYQAKSGGETSQEDKCEGVGNEGCIEKVRQQYSSSNKTILGEEYLGDGKFGITFIDRDHAGTFSSKVFTDCNCNIKNSNVQILK